MARFERRISDEQVAEARKKIAGGATLRAAAAAVPCAPSTLSERIKKAEVLEAVALERAGIATGGSRQTWRKGQPFEDAGADEAPGPIEVLRGALFAMRANGQPDWPTRVTAARALAALRPELVEAPAGDTAATIVVYDLAPRSAPVLHRALPVAEGEVDDIPTPPERSLEPGVYVLSEGDRTVQLAEVDLVAGKGVTIRFLTSREDAFDVLRAVGGDVATLQTFLGADSDAGRS